MSDIGIDPTAGDYAALQVHAHGQAITIAEQRDEIHALKRRVAALEVDVAAWRKDADMWHDVAHALQKTCDDYARADVGRDRIPIQPWTPRRKGVGEL